MALVTTAKSTLIYGNTRTYKSTQIARAAEYVYAKTGRRTRLISAESSSVEIFQPYIEVGIIEPLWMHAKMRPLSALKKLSRGEWPAIETRNGVQGWAWKETPVPEWTKIGGYAWEGLTTFAELCKSVAADQALGVSTEKRASLIYTEDGESIGSSTLQQYGTVQGMMMDLLKQTPKSLFDKSNRSVEYCFFTAHQTKGEDDEGKAVYGPATVGKAITGTILKEVGLVLHHEEYPITTQVKDPANPGKFLTNFEVKVRAHFKPHPDPDNPSMIWSAGPRFAPDAEVLRELDRKFPGGYIPLSLDPPSGLPEYLEVMETLQAKAADSLRKRLNISVPAATGTQTQPVTP